METNMWPFIFNILLIAQLVESESVLAKIATILPSDEKRLFAISKISIAIDIAQLKIKTYNFGDRNITFNVSYADSQCSDSHGMNHAIDMYMKKMVDVFFGPNCDYSVAPVARQVTFWNLPLISGGAMARSFMKKNADFPLLTRAGPTNFNKLSNFIVDMFAFMRWKAGYIIYDRNEQKGVLEEFCNLFATSLHYETKYDYYKMEDVLNERKILVEKIGINNGGRYSFFFSSVIKEISWCYSLFENTIENVILKRRYLIIEHRGFCTFRRFIYR